MAGGGGARAFARKASAESQLGAHSKAAHTVYNGLSTAPNDPQLAGQFHSAVSWTRKDRYFRNEIPSHHQQYQRHEEVEDDAQDEERRRQVRTAPCRPIKFQYNVAYIYKRL